MSFSLARFGGFTTNPHPLKIEQPIPKNTDRDKPSSPVGVDHIFDRRRHGCTVCVRRICQPVLKKSPGFTMTWQTAQRD